MKKLILLIAICTLTFTLTSEARIVKGWIDIEFGKGDGKGGCVYTPFSVCSITISLKANGNSGNPVMKESYDVKEEK